MKKLLTLVTLMLCLNLATKAQDLIVKNDKTEIKAKVIEITDDAIKYKKFEMQDGPTFSIKKADVFMIVYANGTKEYIENTAPVTTTQTPSSSKTNINDAMSNSNGNYEPTKNTASSNARNHTRFGINGALVYSTVNATNTSIESILNFKAGLVLDIPVSSNFSITPELNFLKKGFTEKSLTIINDYIELPINFSYITGNGYGFLIGVAPTFAYGIGATAKNTATQQSARFSFSELESEAFEISGSVFIGCKFKNGMAIKATYNTAFTNYVADEKSKNQYLALGLTVLF